MMPEEIDSIVVTEELAGERLDKILTAHYAGSFSRTYFQDLISQHLVLLNGEPVKKRIKPEVGDEIEVEFVLSREIEILPEKIPLEILYEDEHLIAVNKPVGMVVHPAVGNWSGTFVNALMHHCTNELPSTDDVRPGIVHRLDKETSGVLIAAKTLEAQQRLIALFASREMQKEYLAICLGNPGSDIINEPIGRNPRNRQEMMVVSEGGREAVTEFKAIAFKNALSVVKAFPKTGRTHQIRVHLKFRGTPILGDKVYGNRQSNTYYKAERQLLHAHRLSFSHPITGKNMIVEAPPPQDMQSFIDKIKG